MRNGGGYKIIGCRLGDTRSRGILVKGDHGLIKDNIIDQCGMSAISIGPEFRGDESDYCHDVVVEGNTLHENSRMGYDPGIWVHGDGANGNREIAISQNKISSNYAVDITVEWTEGATIATNEISGSPRWKRDTRSFPALRLKNSAKISLKNNLVENADSYAPGLVDVSDHVTELLNNDSSGIRAACTSPPP